MQTIPDDPIIQSIMLTGYPPWVTNRGYEPDDDDDWEGVSDGDVFYGNQTPSF